MIVKKASMSKVEVDEVEGEEAKGLIELVEDYRLRLQSLYTVEREVVSGARAVYSHHRVTVTCYYCGQSPPIATESETWAGARCYCHRTIESGALAPRSGCQGRASLCIVRPEILGDDHDIG